MENTPVPLDFNVVVGITDLHFSSTGMKTAFPPTRLKLLVLLVRFIVMLRPRVTESGPKAATLEGSVGFTVDKLTRGTSIAAEASFFEIAESEVLGHNIDGKYCVLIGACCDSRGGCRILAIWKETSHFTVKSVSIENNSSR